MIDHWHWAVLQEARLISSKEASSNGHQLYMVDYALRKPGEEEERIFLTAVCLGFNGRCVLNTCILLRERLFYICLKVPHACAG